VVLTEFGTVLSAVRKRSPALRSVNPVAHPRVGDVEGFEWLPPSARVSQLEPMLLAFHRPKSREASFRGCTSLFFSRACQNVSDSVQ
jgi:hypothetical protein